jgi:hypothetical protein
MTGCTAGRGVVVALLKTAALRAALLRHSRAAFVQETAEDAALARLVVKANLYRGAWRYGQAVRPQREEGYEPSEAELAAQRAGAERFRRLRAGR